MAQSFNARIIVTLKNGVLDPQGKAIENGLGSLGFEGVSSVRQGRYFDINVSADSPADAQAKLDAMCEKLLANTVIEDYRAELVE